LSFGAVRQLSAAACALMAATVVKLVPDRTQANRAATNFAERFDIDIPGNDATFDGAKSR
jgi:hypothetical protein